MISPRGPLLLSKAVLVRCPGGVANLRCLKLDHRPLVPR